MKPPESSAPPKIPPQPSTTSIPSCRGDVKNPALRGAAVAFAATSRKEAADVTRRATNGAAEAAFIVGMGQQKASGVALDGELRSASFPKRAFAARTPSDYSITSARIRASPLKRFSTSSSPTLSRESSPSHVAASLAVARSSSTSLANRQERTPTRDYHKGPKNDEEEVKLPAEKLIKLYESKSRGEGNHSARQSPPRIDQERLIKSPTPIRPPIKVQLSTPLSSTKETPRQPSFSFQNGRTAQQPSPQQHQLPGEKSSLTTSRDVSAITRSASTATPSKEPPKPPPPRGSSRALRFTHQDADLPSPTTITGEKDSQTQLTDAILTSVLRPTPSVVSHDQKPPLKPSTRSFSQTSTPTNPRPPLVLDNHPLPPRSRLPSKPLPPSRQPASHSPSQMTVDSLANAIVASHLASSRAPSPTKPSRPPLPARASKTSSLFPTNPDSASRTPSPGKPMRKTLRGPPSPPSNAEERRFKPHLLTHPNKHAEGDRKRWRDEITEAERKRYEGLWAANRGILLEDGEDGEGGGEKEGRRDCVHDLVVKDIWSRSKLSFAVLAEIWDLVDARGERCLRREEFVVGTWLIDQCLKGRKLPDRVSGSVWSSVRGLSGVRIPQH